MSKIKICGLSRMEDIDAVNDSMPDFIGFVFTESSRGVNVRTAAKLKARLNGGIKAVGIFANQETGIIAGLCKDGIVDLVQLHGDEDGEYIRRLRQNCGCRIIKAVSVGERLPRIPDGADYLLFDTASAGRGGTGRKFDWGLLKEYKGLPYFLAGGLDISNIAEAISLLSPFCVDVSSGVESHGLKDREKINAFIQKARVI